MQCKKISRGIYIGHCNFFSPLAPWPPCSKLHGKGMTLTEDYPFTGFLQIWRSVSCVIACVPSIGAALIFFLFAVLIIFISRRFPWLLGGFLKWLTTKLKSKNWASVIENHFQNARETLSDDVVPCSRRLLGRICGVKGVFQVKQLELPPSMKQKEKFCVQHRLAAQPTVRQTQ